MQINKSTKVINVYKEVLITPLEVIRKLQENFSFLKNQKLAYAGRLDPLASGVLLILVGEECKNRDFYQDLVKEYEFECLFGLGTDTFDTLGLIDTTVADTRNQIFDYDQLKAKIESIKNQAYPPYSSFQIKGKPLFAWAKEGKLSEIIIPQKSVSITNVEILNKFTLSSKKLLETVIERTANVKGDFRQSLIRDDWFAKFGNNALEFSVIKIKAQVSSGTYVRSICKELGELLGTNAIALNIERTRVGDFTSLDAFRI